MDDQSFGIVKCFTLGEPVAVNGKPVTVTVDGQPAKPGDKIVAGDEITLEQDKPESYGDRQMKAMRRLRDVEAFLINGGE